jgi:hypothetical protein
VVQHSPRHPKVKGSCSATVGAGGENVGKVRHNKVFQITTVIPNSLVTLFVLLESSIFLSERLNIYLIFYNQK